MKLDTDSQRLVDRLAEIGERRDQLASEEANLKAELRQRLQYDVKYVDAAGVSRVQLQHNRRFSPPRAEKVLDPTTYAQCLVPALDAKKVRSVVAPDTYLACCIDYEPKVILL